MIQQMNQSWKVHLTYTRNAYTSTGEYVGGTTNLAQRVETTYNGSTISFGEYFEVRFPFPNGFILKDYLSV